MRKIFTLILFVIGLSVSGWSQLLTENFSYTAGQAITSNGWTAHSAGGTNPILVTSPGLTYAGHPGSGVGNAITMATSGEDDNIGFTAVTTGSTYMSFLVNVSSATATGDYFVGLLQNGTTFPLRIYAKSSGAGFVFGVNKMNGATPVYESTVRTFGTTYFIVGNYIFNTGSTTDDVVNLWVNPALGGSEPAATIPNVTAAVTDATSNAAAYLRQGGASSSSVQQVDAILVGTTWASVTPSSGGSPALSATTLTAFGNVCISSSAGPNSFTITGTALTTANVTVGALSGYSYSTTSGGLYTSSLNLPQSGGAYSQQIFVKFDPTLIQSYDGNIPVGGGGATTINVAASGSGVNSAPTVTSGAASAITSSGATVAGTIPSTGCTALTAYGIEWSITPGFANGSGTAVPSSNLSGVNFSSALSGLAASTVYYYHAYATNAGGTTYGTQGTFTTAGPATLSATTLTAFGAVCTNTTAGPNSFTITGTGLTTANVTVGPLTGYTFSTTSGGTYTASLNQTQPGGSYSQQVFVKFTPTLVQSYNGNIPVSGGGATAINVAASGSGVNTLASVTTGGSSSVTSNSATAAGSITANGCTAVTAYGIEWSTTAAFTPGTGTQVASTNLAGGNFTSALTGLPASTTIYYYAYATNGGGTAYGTIQSFTTPAAAVPTLSPSALAAFGNVCINTTAGPNSFTITGTSLTAANVTVGALTGYTYSTTSGGTYTTTLSLPQPGGSYSQQIFVKFTPTAVASYNGNIPVGGGGASTVNVAASGAGINTAATVTSGAASAITSTSATVAGTIPSTGCSPLTAYGIEWSTTNGFANGTGTAVASTNLSGVNFTSALSGLAPSTVYYYHAYATTSAGTVYGTQGTFTTLTPTMSVSALTAFGAVCVNTTAGPNSFTITGTNLTTANVNVAALAGFTYSTTSGGTYTATLSLPQTGGAYSQQIFVKFSPTLVQSYNGNIAVSGGGVATGVNVAASGSGINTAPTVTGGAASPIGQTTATVAGTIPATGCSPITAYGIEWSTTAGFANGTGTAVASTNLSGVNFSSNLTGLNLNTVYYYHAYATNGGGTVYSAQGTFTTAPAVLAATPLTAFGNVCINTTAGPNSFTISSMLVNANNINVAALTGYSYSTTATGTYTSSLVLTHPAGPYSQQVFVKFNPTLVASYNGNIVVSGGGATVNVNVAASGAGVNTGATLITNDATNVTRNAATLNGNIGSNGCNPVTEYGIEYSSISGFTPGIGIKVTATNLDAANNFSIDLSNLVPATTYYFRAYAVTSSGKSYGAEKSFTTTGISSDLMIYSNPVLKGGTLRFSVAGIQAAHYVASIINTQGQVVYNEGIIVQVGFIDGKIKVPGKLPAGVYIFQLRNTQNNEIQRKPFILE